MEIYVLKEGRRCGPFLPFKLRELLEDKDYLPSDPGWIEGMDAWAPLSSIEPLAPWMLRDPALPPPLPDLTNPAATHPAAVAASVIGQEVSARRYRAWFRWLARTLDEMLWFLLLWLVGVSNGWLDLWDFMWRNPLLLFAPGIAWVPVEALLLHRFGTTPGKWLFNIHVADDLGQPLTYPAALKRSALVLLLGNGLGLPHFGNSHLSVLPMLQASLGLVLYLRSGSSLWDRAAASVPIYRTPSAAGMVIVGVITAAWLGLITWISVTAPIPPDAPAEQRAAIEDARRQLEERYPATVPSTEAR